MKLKNKLSTNIPINNLIELVNKRVMANIEADLMKPEFKIDYIRMIKKQLLEGLMDAMVDDDKLFSVVRNGSQVEIKCNVYILNKEQMSVLIKKVSEDTMRCKTILELNTDE